MGALILILAITGAPILLEMVRDNPVVWENLHPQFSLKN
jgi:hypothetical protein